MAGAAVSGGPSCHDILFNNASKTQGSVLQQEEVLSALEGTVLCLQSVVLEHDICF